MEIKQKIEEFIGYEIIPHTRKKEYRKYRQIACYLYCKYTQLTLCGIGNILKVHHATVLHSVKSVKNEMKYNKSFCNEIHDIEKSLNYTGVYYCVNEKMYDYEAFKKVFNNSSKCTPVDIYIDGEFTESLIMSDISDKQILK